MKLYSTTDIINQRGWTTNLRQYSFRKQSWLVDFFNDASYYGSKAAGYVIVWETWLVRWPSLLWLVYHYHHHIWISAPEAIPQCLIHSETTVRIESNLPYQFEPESSSFGSACKLICFRSANRVCPQHNWRLPVSNN